MASGQCTFYRNISNSDTTTSSNSYSTSQSIPSAEDLGWTQTGYIFSNWSQNRDGSGYTYTSSNTFSTLFNQQNPPATVYAQWVEIPDLIITTSTNTNPSTLGKSGIYTLIDKKFASTRVSDTSIFIPNPNYTSSSAGYLSPDSVIITRSGHFIEVELEGTTGSSDWGDETNYMPGYFNFSSLGLNSFTDRVYFTAWSDNGDALLTMQMYDSYDVTYPGYVLSGDVIAKTSGGNLPAGSKIYVKFFIHTTKEEMLDSACDKFYWEKVSESLVNTTWTFDDEIEDFPTTRYFYMNFFYNGSTAYMCTCMEWASGAGYYTRDGASNPTMVYDAIGSGWAMSNYQTITFISEPTDTSAKAEFLAWLPEHATYQS